MIAVVGGTGTAGRAAVDALLAADQAVKILSRNPPVSMPTGAIHSRLDLTRDDPAGSLQDADVLLDLASSSSRPASILEQGTGRLLAACEEVGVGHYVGLSIVGCEQVGLGYYRAKRTQEKLIEDAGIGWSLLRASQFHELLDGLMTSTARFGLLPAGEALLQPVSSEVVGERLALIARGRPTRAPEQITGPRIQTLGDLAGTWIEATGRKRLRLRLPLPGRTGRALKAGALADAASSAPGPDFSEWLTRRYG